MGAGWFFSPHAAARSKSGCRSLTARNRNNSPRREKTGIRTGPISVARRDGCHAMRLGACRLNAVTPLAPSRKSSPGFCAWLSRAQRLGAPPTDSFEVLKDARSERQLKKRQVKKFAFYLLLMLNGEVPLQSFSKPGSKKPVERSPRYKGAILARRSPSTKFMKSCRPLRRRSRCDRSTAMHVWPV